MHNVGMRFRGSKSRGVNDLDGFKLDFQKLYKGEMLDKKPKFGGRSQLNILSIENHDLSLIGQCLAYKTMREFGDVPAPLCNHLRVFVNDALYGVLENVEAVDEKPFLTRNFQDNNDGSFYGGSAACGYPDSKADLKYNGDTFTGDYLMEYEPIQAKDVTTPETDLIPMLKCGDATATPDPAAFKACISEWIDVPEWLKLIAAESLMPTLESFTGTLRNYFLYFKADPTSVHGGRFVIYSWDYDTAFQHSGCYPTSCDPLVSVASWFGPARGRAALVKRLTTEFRAEYCAAMNAFLKNTYKPKLVDDLTSVLAPIVTTSPFMLAKAPFAVTDWQTQTMALRDFITTHGQAAQAQVDAICAPPGGTQ
jgi:spore coat protein CotH